MEWRKADQIVDLLQREAHSDQHRLVGVATWADVAVVVLEQLAEQPLLVRRNCNETKTSNLVFLTFSTYMCTYTHTYMYVPSVQYMYG